MIIIEFYVDDIIFRSDDDRLSQNILKDMQQEFEMSLLGELKFFLGLQISQQADGIFISQSKYIKEMLKRFQMCNTPRNKVIEIGVKFFLKEYNSQSRAII